MTSDVNYIDNFFSFLTGVIRNFSAFLSKFGVFIRNWPACFEKASFLYAGSSCTTAYGLETGCNQLATIHRIESTRKHIGGRRGKSGARVMAIIDHLHIQNKGRIYLMCCLTVVIKSDEVIF